MMKRYAPATERNREPIAHALDEELPAEGMVLEVASGSGEHALYLAARFAHLQWQPTDYDDEALASIAAWRQEAGLANILAPLKLDARSTDWPVDNAAAIFCANMIHISPVSATQGLILGAARILEVDAPLICYGPFIEAGVPTAASNLAFDESLRERDAQWGLREIEWLDELAASADLKRTRRVDMPANNLILVYRKLKA